MTKDLIAEASGSELVLPSKEETVFVAGSALEGNHLEVSENGGYPKWTVYYGKHDQNGWFEDTRILGNLDLSLKNPKIWYNFHLFGVHAWLDTAVRT